MAFNPATGKFESGFGGQSRPTVVKKPSSRFNPDRRLDVTGRNRVISQQASNSPAIRQSATDSSTASVGSGSSRSAIAALQRRLNADGANLVVDGVWGPKTQAAQSGSRPSGSGSGGSSGGGGGGFSGGDFSGGFSGGAQTVVDRSVKNTQTNKDIDALRAERLQAALAAIGAQFDFEEGGLNQQLTALKDLFKTTRKENARTGERQVEGIGDAAAERGIFKSGINAEAMGEEFARQAEEKAKLIGTLDYRKGREGTQVREIMSAIALLGQQQASAEGQAKIDNEKDELDMQQLIALVGAGLQ